MVSVTFFQEYLFPKLIGGKYFGGCQAPWRLHLFDALAGNFPAVQHCHENWSPRWDFNKKRRKHLPFLKKLSTANDKILPILWKKYPSVFDWLTVFKMTVPLLFWLNACMESHINERNKFCRVVTESVRVQHINDQIRNRSKCYWNTCKNPPCI